MSVTVPDKIRIEPSAKFMLIIPCIDIYISWSQCSVIEFCMRRDILRKWGVPLEFCKRLLHMLNGRPANLEFFKNPSKPGTQVRKEAGVYSAIFRIPAQFAAFREMIAEHAHRIHQVPDSVGVSV